jgi:hypothetical protein
VPPGSNSQTCGKSRNNHLQLCLKSPGRIHNNEARSSQPATGKRFTHPQFNFHHRRNSKILECRANLLGKILALHRIPDQEYAIGKTPHAILQRYERQLFFIFQFIGRIDQHQPAPLRRRQIGLHQDRSINAGDPRARINVIPVPERRIIIGMQFIQRETVLGAQQPRNDFRRTRAAHEAALRVQVR